MAIFKCSYELIEETRVFQIPVGQGAFTVILFKARVESSAIDATIFLPTDSPVMLCKVPSSAWSLLWPEIPEPLPWIKIRALHHGIQLYPNLSRYDSGGILAYFSLDTRVPINGKTTITWFNFMDTDEPVSSKTAITWDELLRNTMPKLPFPRLKHQFFKTIINFKPKMIHRADLFPALFPQTSSSKLLPSLQKRDPKQIVSFFIGGVVIAVIMALVVFLTAYLKAKRMNKQN